jgi:hypothetical protein
MQIPIVLKLNLSKSEDLCEGCVFSQEIKQSTNGGAFCLLFGRNVNSGVRLPECQRAETPAREMANVKEKCPDSATTTALTGEMDSVVFEKSPFEKNWIAPDGRKFYSGGINVIYRGFDKVACSEIRDRLGFFTHCDAEMRQGAADRAALEVLGFMEGSAYPEFPFSAWRGDVLDILRKHGFIVFEGVILIAPNG